MPSLAVDGIHLSYDVRGEGLPVVLLHGFTSRASSWEAHGWVDLLVGVGCRAVTLDVRSHGRSDHVFDAVLCSTVVLAGDVIALLDHLEIEEAALVGFSMGGGIALRVAMDAPSRVSRLLVAGVGDAALNALHAPAEIASLVAAFSGRQSDGSAARIQRNAELAGNDLRALLPFLLNGGWPGGLSEPSPVAVPTLLVVAEADEYMAGHAELLEWLPDVRVVTLARASHYEVLGNETAKREAVDFLRGR